MHLIQSIVVIDLFAYKLEFIVKPHPVKDYPAMRLYVAINYACAIVVGTLGILAALLSIFTTGDFAAAIFPVIFSIPVVLLLMLSAETIKIVIDIKHDLGGIAHVLYEQHLQRLKEAELSNPPAARGSQLSISAYRSIHSSKSSACPPVRH